MIDTTFTPQDLNAGNCGLGTQLGIEYTALSATTVSAKMPVDERTRQPYGRLHGGASAALAETLGSMASWLCIDRDKYYPVGLELNVNHLRPVSGGWVFGTASALHLGRKTHVWDIKITAESGKLVCVGRLTVMIMAKEL